MIIVRPKQPNIKHLKNGDATIYGFIVSIIQTEHINVIIEVKIHRAFTILPQANL